MIRDEQPKEKKIERSDRKTTFTGVIDALTLSAVFVILLVVALAYITEITPLGSVDYKKVGMQAIILYACTVSSILLMRGYGRRKGEQTEAYIKARDKVCDNAGKIIEKAYNVYVYNYCRAWEENDLATEQKKTLQNVGVTLEDYRDKYCKYGKNELIKAFPELTKVQVKGILQTKRIKRLKYDERYLLAKGKRTSPFRSSPSGGLTADGLNAIEVFRTFVTAALTSVFSVSFVLEIIENPTYETIVACLVKITCIIVSAIFGMINGYRFASAKKTAEMERLAKEQEEFILYCEHEESIEKNKIPFKVGLGTT